MARTIWKFPLASADFQQIEMPVGAEVLHAHMNQGQPCVWALVDSQAETELRGFYMHGTGHPVSANIGRYVGTVHIWSSNIVPILVFHIFEELRRPVS